MLDRIRAKLCFANVVSLVALFVVLGGGAYAAATITGGDIVNNSITGVDVKERTLKGVTRCPKSAPNRVANVCFSKSFAGTSWTTALGKCASRKLRLPTIGEGFLIYRKAGKGETWTDEVVELTPTDLRATVKKTGSGVSPIGFNTNGPKPYRCVTIPTA
jgi:hypothetical protein